MQQVNIGDVQFSKVICGTNPFLARSHFSAARDAEYRTRFDDQGIERMIARCLEWGINTVESSANERVWNLLSKMRNTTGKAVHFVGSTRIDDTSEMKTTREKLSFLIQNSAEVCVIHARFVDRRRKEGAIPGLEELIGRIHEAGLLAGISAHQVDTVELCEKNAVGIDTYLFPLNLTGVVYPGYQGRETVQDRVDLVRGVAKPFIIIKALGAGRIPPDEGLQFVAEHTKPRDLVSLGFGTEEELVECVKLVEEYF